MKKSTKTMVVGAAMAGLFSGSAAMAAQAANVGGNSPEITKAGIALQTMGDKEKDTHSCKGKNECKGKGGCKSGDNGCKGKNSCKGHGGCATDGSKEKEEK